MTSTRQPPEPRPAHEDLDAYIARYEATLRDVYRDRVGAADMHVRGGMPPSVLRELLAHRPLAAFIPKEHGGRGGHIHEIFALVERTGYESLALALTLGINGALFLQPVAKYGRDEIKPAIFDRFLRHQNMGGLMMTEPGYGSDALNMETAYESDGEGGFALRGTKHWAGLTGLADYWLVAARSHTESGRLSRDVDFFVCDTHDPDQAPQVEEIFDNLGLHLIPYGRSRIDLRVPEAHRLVPASTGLKMMLDMLHRSRFQFPGMAMGYLRRLLDEAIDHVENRPVGGQMLFAYDQVQQRLAELQAAVTACNAMCVYSSENARVDMDLSKQGIAANAIKAVVTDSMHASAQSLLQLVGARGYRLSHIAGRSLLDSRPFMIFEGSNDILYEQLAQVALKMMQRGRYESLSAFMQDSELAARASEYFRDETHFRVEDNLPQRKVVDLGRALGRVLVIEMVIELGSRGFSQALVTNAVEHLRVQVESLLTGLHSKAKPTTAEERDEMGSWHAFLDLEKV